MSTCIGSFDHSGPCPNTPTLHTPYRDVFARRPICLPCAQARNGGNPVVVRHPCHRLSDFSYVSWEVSDQ
jgi:hypothetical protein